MALIKKGYYTNTLFRMMPLECGNFLVYNRPVYLQRPSDFRYNALQGYQFLWSNVDYDLRHFA